MFPQKIFTSSSAAKRERIKTCSEDLAFQTWGVRGLTNEWAKLAEIYVCPGKLVRKYFIISSKCSNWTQTEDRIPKKLLYKPFPLLTVLYWIFLSELVSWQSNLLYSEVTSYECKWVFFPGKCVWNYSPWDVHMLSITIFFCLSSSCCFCWFRVS